MRERRAPVHRTARNPDQSAIRPSDRGAEDLRDRRLARLQWRGQGLAQLLGWAKGLLPLPREDDLQDARARLPLSLPGLQPVPGMPRHATSDRSPLLEMAGPDPAQTLPASGRPAAGSGRILWRRYAPIPVR